MSEHRDPSAVMRKSTPIAIAAFLGGAGLVLYIIAPGLENVFKTFQLSTKDVYMIYCCAVCFTALWIALDRVFFQSYLKLLEAREAATLGAADAALKLEREAMQLTEEYETKISEARRQAAAAKTKSIVTAKADAGRIIQEAQAQARTMLAEARAKHSQELKRLLSESSSKVSELSKSVTVKLQSLEADR